MIGSGNACFASFLVKGQIGLSTGYYSYVIEFYNSICTFHAKLVPDLSYHTVKQNIAYVFDCVDIWHRKIIAFGFTFFFFNKMFN